MMYQFRMVLTYKVLFYLMTIGEWLKRKSLHEKKLLIMLKNKGNYICEQDQKNRIVTTAFKDYKRQIRFCFKKTRKTTEKD